MLIIYLLSPGSVLLLSSHRLLSVRLFVCTGQRNYRKEAENDILFANQFGNTLCPDEISFDAFKTELEAKVKELNEKYPKTMPLKISSGSGFIHIDQDTKTHNNGCDKPVAYFSIYRVKGIYRFSERPQIEKKGGAK